VDAEEIRTAVQLAIESIAPDVDARRIRPDAPLRPQIEFDSMDWLNLVACLHERLHVDIPESDYGRLASVDSIVGYLSSRRPANAGDAPDAPRAESNRPNSRTHLVEGVRVTVRPIRHEDRALEAAFVQSLSGESRYERFMVAVSELPPSKLDSLIDVDQVGHVALVATVERDGQEALVGAVRYAVLPPGTRCEFAVAVADDWHGTGLAGILMGTLIAIARGRGLAAMEGIVLATNTRMLKFARQLGFRRERDPGERDVVRIVREL
jgi:acetyltransferase